MDLLSLPQEMLASVLKYVEFEQLIGIRKLSSRIDSAVKKYHLSMMTLDELRIELKYDHFEIRLTQRRKVFIVRTEKHEMCLPTMLQFYFSKIRRLRVLHFMKSRYIITDEVTATILQQSEKRIKSLQFYQCELLVPVNLLRQILTTLSITELSIITYVTEDTFSPYNDEIYKGLQFNELILYPLGRGNTSGITINSIEAMCTRKLPEHLKLYKMKVTVRELGPFLERIWDDLFDTKNMSWHFEVQADNMTIEEVQQYVRSINCLQKYRSRFFEPIFIFDDLSQPSQVPFLCIFIRDN